MSKIFPKNMSKLKNAQESFQPSVFLKYSKVTSESIKILREEGFIRGASYDTKGILVYLKYLGKKPLFNNILLVSKPSRKVYYGYNDLIRSSVKAGLFVLSTSSGIISSKKALKEGCGGEVLFYIS